MEEKSSADIRDLKGHNPLAVANYFIENRNEIDKEGVFLMKLIKLCYFAHAFTLANTDEILINEYAEAWQYGPVFPSIFHEFKTARPIKDKAQKYNSKTDSLEDWSSNFNEIEIDIMSQVNRIYGKLTGGHLSALTHKEGTPWSKTWEIGQPIRGLSIRNEGIKEYYKDQISRSHSSE